MSSANDEKTEDEDEIEDDYDFGTKGEQLAAPCTLLSPMNLRKGFSQKITARHSRNHKGRGVGGSACRRACNHAERLNEAAERPSGMDNFIL